MQLVSGTDIVTCESFLQAGKNLKKEKNCNFFLFLKKSGYSDQRPEKPKIHERLQEFRQNGDFRVD